MRGEQWVLFTLPLLGHLKPVALQRMTSGVLVNIKLTMSQKCTLVAKKAPQRSQWAQIKKQDLQSEHKKKLLL